MKREQYFYNPSTLQYEKVEVNWKGRLLKFFGFACATLFAALIIATLTLKYGNSPRDLKFKQEIAKMRTQYQLLEKDVDQMSAALEALRYRDGNIYRTILESDPIPDEVWNVGVGGSNKYRDLKKFDNADLMVSLSSKVDKVNRQLLIQSKSFEEIIEKAEQKEDMLASVPSIQPLHNKKLTRIASGFGWRLHPVYKVRKMHHGMDFTAPTGTPIYATGKGTVELVKKSRRGYGNQIVINHGYGYKSLYAHCSKFNVREGQKVKRGEVIGYVGNTGTSTAPHLHYEVIKGNQKVNPVYYFQNDLEDDQYDKVLLLANTDGQSLD